MFNRILRFSLLDFSPSARLGYVIDHYKLSHLSLLKGGETNVFCFNQTNCNYSTSQPVPITGTVNGNRSLSSDSKIYTKTGDLGTSSLYTGERKPKNDLVFNVLGNIDELSSFIGAAKENALERKHAYVEQLERIQCILQDVGTLVATPMHLNDIQDEERKQRVEKRIRFSERHILELETWIDQHTESLPPLTNFILPGGGRTGASLHVCRSVCRRAERSLVPLAADDVVDKNVLVYLNRLSDYLFTVSRVATILDGKKETIYIRPKPGKGDRKDKTDVKVVQEKG